jgi:hypothetical protein
LLNASASSHHDSDAGSEREYTEGDDAETLAVWAFRRWILGLIRFPHRDFGWSDLVESGFEID